MFLPRTTYRAKINAGKTHQLKDGGKLCGKKLARTYLPAHGFNQLFPF